MGNSFSRDSIGEGLDNMRLADNFFEALGPPFTCQYKIGHGKEVPIKSPGPEGLRAIPRGGFNGPYLRRESPEVMEWWSIVRYLIQDTRS
jgi:hypothetical protein